MGFDLKLVLELLLASACGAVLGLEREIHRKPAGLRTNMLIALGATLFTYCSFSLFSEGGNRGDPARIAAQIVVGIGFIGAGTIMRHEDQITGLTSAATVWVVAAIGILIGANRWLAAITATVMALAILHLLVRLEGYILTKLVKCHAQLTADDREAILADIEAYFRRQGIVVQGVTHHPGADGQTVEVAIDYFTMRGKQAQVEHGLAEIAGIRAIRARIL